MAKKSFNTDDKKVKKAKKSGGEARELVTINFASSYRPRLVDDYVGQDHVLKMFAGWVKSGKFPATILISGNTGSGKTTFARIIGKYVNCRTLDACGTCPSCVQYEAGRHPDIMEYDMGGDHGKVEGSGNIVSSANLSPMFNRRVFILDESHLMSSAAESKFLKITEEPPAKTIWIFVTTNPEKMKATMIGRMTKINIQPIASSIISGRLQEIAKQEGILPKDKDERKKAVAACDVIAEYAGGQMRGAIGMLQSIYGSVCAGEAFDKSLVNTIASADPEIDLEAKGVQLIAAFLAMDLLGVVQFLREANNPRGLLSKTRWTLHGILGHLTNTNKWQTAGLKMFLNLSRAEKLDINPVSIVYLQKCLADCETAFNSTSVPEAIQLESSITALMCDIYRNEVQIDLGNVPEDDEDDKPRKKKKSDDKKSSDGKKKKKKKIKD